MRIWLFILSLLVAILFWQNQQLQKNISPHDNTSNSAYERVTKANQITCGVVSWPPTNYIDPKTGQWEGFMIDYLRQAFATIDLQVVFKEVISGTQVQELKSGRIDAMCIDGPWVMSLGKFVEFSNPMMASFVYPYVRVDDKRLTILSDLNNSDIRFLGLDGDLSVDLAQRLYLKARLLTMPGTTDFSQLLLNVVTKKADVVITDPGTFDGFDKNNPNTLRPLQPEKPVGFYKVVMSVEKGNLPMLGLVNEAIDNAHAFGITDKVLDGYDPYHKRLKRVANPFKMD
jgi:ABC-type amino acid transport substrate-binding protein